MQFSGPDQHWFIKYRLYHIPFWFLYNYLWWAITINSPSQAAWAIFFSPFATKFTFFVVFETLANYFNLYFLIPRLLEKQRYITYTVSLVITIAATATMIVLGYYLGAFIAGKQLQDLYGKENCSFYHLFIGSPLSSTMASMTLGMSIKLAKNWIQTQQRQQMLEKEKLETELNFLKYQFNPHFLFNTINSIFFLIHKNPDKASASLAKFSDLLRYQLYECNDKQIPLSQEILYMENTIELEKLRQNDNIEVSLQVHAPSQHLGIAPFILMTFVENAFKHVSKHTDQPNWIRINLESTGHELFFSVSNSNADNKIKDVVHYGGIGLKNVQRRLELLYPGQYNLNIESDRSCFDVHLRLHLAELITQPV
jgi:two-component system, LytTR family, sensor kinase